MRNIYFLFCTILLILLVACTNKNAIEEGAFAKYQDCIDALEYPETYLKGEIVVTTKENVSRLEFETSHERINSRISNVEGEEANLLVDSVEPVYYISVTLGLEREWICVYLESELVATANFISKAMERNPKLDSVLTLIASKAEVSVEKALDLAKSESLKVSENRVQVQISIRPVGVKNAIKVINDAGGEVTGTGYGDTLIQAWLPVTALEIVASHEDIYFIQRPAEIILFD